MEEEVVKRRRWLSHEYFLDLLGATNLIPGPNSSEMAIHIGFVRAGLPGLIVAGVCFISPAVIISLLLAHFYVRYGSIPQVGHFVWGIRSGVIAVILAALFRLAKPLVKNRFVAAVSIAVFVLNLCHVDEIILLIVAGIVGLLWGIRDRITHRTLPLFLAAILPIAVGTARTAGTGGTPPGPTIFSLGLFFLKIGSILYGSGYVLVAFLQGGLVDARHWLAQTQLLDAIAVGQFTPGPVLSTATFIGYIILGVPGAAAATVGIFLPSFVFVLLTGRFVPRLRKLPASAGFLDGVNAASLGLMLSVCITLGAATLSGFGSWIIFLVAAVVVVRWSFHAGWIIGGAALAGWIFSMFGIVS
jgi:chromate transporter